MCGLSGLSYFSFARTHFKTKRAQFWKQLRICRFKCRLKKREARESRFFQSRQKTGEMLFLQVKLEKWFSSLKRRECQICIFFIIPVEVAQERKTKLNIRKAHFWLLALIENTSQTLKPERLMASSHKASLRASTRNGRRSEQTRPGTVRNHGVINGPTKI